MLQQKFVFLIVSPEGISQGYLPRREFLVHEIWGPSVILEIVLQSGFVLSLQSVTPHLHQHLVLFDLLIFSSLIDVKCFLWFSFTFLGLLTRLGIFSRILWPCMFPLVWIAFDHYFFSCWSVCPFWSWVASACSDFKQDFGSLARDWSQAEEVRLLNSSH